MKILKSCLPALLLVSFSGCVTAKSCIDECVINCRNQCYAEMAWLSCRSNYCDQEYRCDFGKGFRDGYVAVASGASTCLPAMPPESYWHFEYQNPDGQARQLAWFNGYSYGAIYAEQEGISDWSRVVTAPTLPAYRKRRPPKISGTTAGDIDPTAPAVDGVQPFEPMPSDEPRDPPSPQASNGLIELDEPEDEDAKPATATRVRWTEGANAY